MRVHHPRSASEPKASDPGRPRIHEHRRARVHHPRPACRTRLHPRASSFARCEVRPRSGRTQPSTKIACDFGRTSTSRSEVRVRAASVACSSLRAPLGASVAGNRGRRPRSEGITKTSVRRARVPTPAGEACTRRFPLNEGEAESRAVT